MIWTGIFTNRSETTNASRFVEVLVNVPLSKSLNGEDDGSREIKYSTRGFKAGFDFFGTRKEITKVGERVSASRREGEKKRLT